jgi:hypothetical protein
LQDAPGLSCAALHRKVTVEFGSRVTSLMYKSHTHTHTHTHTHRVYQESMQTTNT